MGTKKEKLQKIQTSVGIHTLNGTIDNLIDLRKAKKLHAVTESNYRQVRSGEELETYIRINPNANGGHVWTEYSTFKNVMNDIFKELNITGFELKRADLSFNSSDPEFYTNYMKLFRLLIACFASDSNDKNTTDSKKFWQGATKSLYTKNQVRAVEFYDKHEQDENSPYYARFELRSLRINSNVEHEFLDVWFKRLDSAIKQFEKVQDRFNQCVAKEFMADSVKKKRYRKFLSLNSFLMEKSDCIFTREQMIKLLHLLGFSEKKAKYKVYNFKKEHEIEFYSIKDLELLVDYIKNEIRNYFSK